MKKYIIDEKPFYDAASYYVVEQLLRGIRPTIKEDICDWCESHIDLSFDHTSSATGLVKLYPYQKEPLRAIDGGEAQEVTICATQRVGKSQLWKFALLKHIHDGGCSGIVVYPSLDLGIRTNKDTLLPLLQELPEANKDLAIRGNRLIGSYHIPSCSSVIHFLGGGSQIISSTANFVVMDETDFFELGNVGDDGKNMSQLKALRLRMQTFKQRCLIACSSPTLYGGTIYSNWKKSSMGIWHLRCLHCGELSPCNKLAYYSDDGKWRGLQWQTNENEEVIEDSIRWICPHCGYAHVYADAQKMNDLGEFVHQRPSNTLHRGFIISALSNPVLWSWREVAQAQIDSSNDLDSRKYLHNTILAMPYKPAKELEESGLEESNRQKQIEYPQDLQDRLSIVLMAVDQQAGAGEKYYCSVVRGFDEQGNSYLLGAWTDHSLQELEQHLQASYYGHKVTLCLIDQGGFSNDVDMTPFVLSHSNTYYYKGTSGKILDNAPYKPSQTDKRLFLADALRYQVRLLEYMYSPHKQGHYGWFLPIEVDSTYFEQICNVQPNSHAQKNANGQDYSEWASFAGNRRDFFDCEKQILVALDIACAYIPANKWLKGHIPLFKAKEKLLEIARKKKLGRA